MNDKKLWIPGPVQVEKNILEAQSKNMIGHREVSFTKLYKGITEKMEEFFEAQDYHIITHTSSGTLWMDITARNLISERALSATCGSFSERMHKTIMNCGKEVDQLKFEWGTSSKPEIILEKLREKKYDCLTVVHNETSTGIKNPTEKIGELIKSEFPEITYVIDAVSSLGGDYILPKSNNADLIFSASQKAFGLPPGLSFGLISDEAFEKAKQISGRGMYTDLVGLIDYYLKKNQTPSTPAISLLYALDMRLDQMLEEGHINIFKRHQEMASYTKSWVIENNMRMFAEDGYESVTVSTIANDQKRSITDLNKELNKRGYLISNGYGVFKEKNFRIGHMGIWGMDDLKELLENIEEIWNL